MPDEVTEIDVTYEDFITFAAARNREDAERASTAGESRQKIGEFIEETGVNGRALGFCRSILKQKKYGTQMDMIRTVKELLPHVEAYVQGQGGPELPFDEPVKDTVAEVADEVSEADLGDIGEAEVDDDDFTEADLADEEDDFNATLAQAAE